MSAEDARRSRDRLDRSHEEVGLAISTYENKRRERLRKSFMKSPSLQPLRKYKAKVIIATASQAL
jgi:hypothetical protein